MSKQPSWSELSPNEFSEVVVELQKWVLNFSSTDECIDMVFGYGKEPIAMLSPKIQELLGYECECS